MGAGLRAADHPPVPEGRGVPRQRRRVDRGAPVSGRTTATGQCARCRTAWLTDPSTRPATAPRLREPTTTSFARRDCSTRPRAGAGAAGVHRCTPGLGVLPVSSRGTHRRSVTPERCRNGNARWVLSGNVGLAGRGHRRGGAMFTPMPEELQATFYADRHVRLCGAGKPSGKGRPVPGGVRMSGRWPLRVVLRRRAVRHRCRDDGFRRRARRVHGGSGADGRCRHGPRLGHRGDARHAEPHPGARRGDPGSDAQSHPDRPPSDGRVVCVDEFGPLSMPLNMMPRPGYQVIDGTVGLDPGQPHQALLPVERVTRRSARRGRCRSGAPRDGRGIRGAEPPPAVAGVDQVVIQQRRG